MSESTISSLARPGVSAHRQLLRLPVLVAGIAVLSISLNEYQIFYSTHKFTGNELIEASQGVLQGHPPWRAFQARLLGPLAFAGFEAVMSWVRAICPPIYSAFERIFSQPETRQLAILDAFVAMMLLAKDFACFMLLLRYSGSLVKSTGGTILGGVLFIVLIHRCLYMWDLFELLFFSIFAFMIFQNRKLGASFFLLYALSLANRESAAFFGVWLLCYAAASRLFDRRTLWWETIFGVALVVIAVLYVAALRESLLVESTLGHEAGSVWSTVPIHFDNGTSYHQALGNHLLLMSNGVTFLKNLVSTHLYVDVYVLLLVFHAGVLIYLGTMRRDVRVLAIGMFNLVLLAGVLNFALINETRLYLICIPFLVFSIVTFDREIFSFLAQIDRRFALGLGHAGGLNTLWR